MTGRVDARGHDHHLISSCNRAAGLTEVRAHRRWLRDAWKSPDAKLFVFTGQVFGEKTLGRQQ